MPPQIASHNRTELFPLFGGDWGTAQTVAKIRQLVDQGKKSIEVNRAAIAITWNTPNFSESPKAQAIFYWVLENTRFIPDINGVETLRTADEILRVRGGDCDDLNAILIPSLLATIGIPSRLVTIAHHPDDPKEFTHIYSEAFVDGRWIPMDVARPGAAFGRGPEHYFRKRIWDLESNAFQDVARLNGYLGDDSSSSGVNYNSLANTLFTGTSDIILAENANPANIYGTVTTTPASLASGTALAGGSGSLILLLLLGVGAVVLFNR